MGCIYGNPKLSDKTRCVGGAVKLHRLKGGNP
jgi:hypothetical protein